MRTLSNVVGIALAICLLLGGAHSQLLATDWTMGRADAQGSGASSENLPQDLELLWEVEIDGLGFDAGPIIADGKVFANDHDGRILALDLNTGKEIWRKEYEAGFVATPSFKEGLLFAADFEGVLHALNAQDGSEKWKFKSGAEITGSPVFYKESVVFTSQVGALFRLERATGKEVWRYETDEPILCGAALAGTVTFLGGCDEQLHLVNLETGERIGEPKQIGPTQSTPCVTESRVLIPTHGGEIFNFSLSGKPVELKETWTFQDRQMATEFRNSIAVAGEVAIASGGNKRAFALDVKTGTVKWSTNLRRKASASPIIAGDSAIIAGVDGTIYRLAMDTGKELWQYQVKGAFLGSPASAAGKLVLANDRGTIFCFGEKN